MNISIFTHFKQ